MSSAYLHLFCISANNNLTLAQLYANLKNAQQANDCSLCIKTPCNKGENTH